MKSEINKNIFDILICLVVVCILIVPTLNRGWLFYDEAIIHQGDFFPTPLYFSEIFEIIQNLSLNFNLISSNINYTYNYVIRHCPLDHVFWMISNYFLKKDPFSYHTLNLILHLINTCFVYLILKTSVSKRVVIFLLTLIWAVHPAMMEAVLLSTNWLALLSYMFFFALFLDFLKNKEKNISNLRRILIPILFLIPMLTNEYIVTLPLVLFIVAFYENYITNTFKTAVKKSFLETLPYFVGLICYLIFYLFLSNYKTTQSQDISNITTTLERVFWLSPQIFFHMIKLVFYPKVLSIDQTLFVKLGKSLFDPYSIFCMVFFFAWLFIPLFSFILKKKMSSFFLLSSLFFLALLPFLHILVPSYTLSAERYLYCPLALLFVGLGKIISTFKTRPPKAGPPSAENSKIETPVILFFSLILALCFGRSYYRTLDWKDNYSFINSTYKSLKDPFFKAIRLGMLGKVMSIYEPNEKTKIENYFTNTLALLEEARNKILKEKLKYKGLQPSIIKAYGLDYDSLLTRIAFFEVSSRHLELKEDYKKSLEILEPYLTNNNLAEPRIIELYSYLLVLDKRYNNAKDVLLKANSKYPNISFLLTRLFEFFYRQEGDKTSAEKYLTLALKYYKYDSSVLLNALNFYQDQNNPLLTARYAYLYGLKTRSKTAYQISLLNFLNLKDLQNAKNIVNKLLKIDPDDPKSLYFISRYFYMTNDYQKSLSYLKHAYLKSIELNLDPQIKSEIASSLVNLLSKTGNKDEAH